MADFLVSRTDPDASLMPRSGGIRPGYHVHYAVDGGRARVILQVLTTPSEVMENTPMLDLLWRCRFRWRLRPKHVTGDTTYGTAENNTAIEDEGIRAYVPLPDFDKRTPYYGKREFRYERGRDEYRCPQGQTLQRRTAKRTERVVVYQAAAATCNACSVKARCTPSGHGRIIHRGAGEEYLERVRGYHETEGYRRALRKRRVWVEPLFGEAKQWHGLRRFRLRCLGRVNIEALLIATGQNLKRLLGWRGWRRRHFLGGAAGVALVPAQPPLDHL